MALFEGDSQRGKQCDSWKAVDDSGPLRQWTLLRANQILVRKPGCCQLHSILGPERMSIGQLLRRADNSGSHI